MLLHRACHRACKSLLYKISNTNGLIRVSYSNQQTIMSEAGSVDQMESNAIKEQSLEGYKQTLSKRALKKFERTEKWKQKKLEKKAPKSRKPGAPEPGFGAHLYEETDYYLENGLRKVYPYYYTFTTYVKQRWIGRTILDVFTSEFRAQSEQSYQKAIDSGQLTVNGNKVSTEYVLKDNELLAHTIHRHENPVVGCPVEVLVDTEDLIVINKPSSIPCHPCGKYRHNSIVFIVGRQLGCSNLRNIYRLDRLTSGVLIMGKTTKKTKELEDQILNRQVCKEYVCRVVGNFPDGQVECKEPLGVISQKLGLFTVRSDGKPSHTTFEKLSYNGKSSVVRCRPHTGRTHQIRVHLQFLGHPIVNDPFYNSEAWGPNKNKGGIMERTDQEVSDRLMELHNIGHWTDGENPLFAERLQEIEESKKPLSEDKLSTEYNTKTIESPVSREEGEGQEPPCKRSRSDVAEPCVPPRIDLGSVDYDPSVPRVDDESKGTKTPDSNSLLHSSKLPDSVETTEAGNRPVSETQEEGVSKGNIAKEEFIPTFDRTKWIPDVNCSSCKQKYVDPTPSELVMYLHALRYSGPDWEYSTPVPDWAKEEWTVD